MRNCEECNLVNHPTAEDWKDVEVLTDSLMRFCHMVPDLKATRQGENTLELSKHVRARRILALVKQIFSRDFCVIQCAVMNPPDSQAFTAFSSQSHLTVQGPFLLCACRRHHDTRPCFWRLVGEFRLPTAFVQFNTAFRVLELLPNVPKRCWSESVESGWAPVAVNRGLCAKEDFNFGADGPGHLEQSQLDVMS